MGECGCSSNWKRYWFPAPNKQIYLLTLSDGCTNCYGPPGISIELISKDSYLWKDRNDYLNGELKFESWAESLGVAIKTGPEQHEFVESLKKWLIGINSKELGEDKKTIDRYGAEVILEDMYPDAIFCPQLITSVVKGD